MVVLRCIKHRRWRPSHGAGYARIFNVLLRNPLLGINIELEERRSFPPFWTQNGNGMPRRGILKLNSDGEIQVKDLLNHF